MSDQFLRLIPVDPQLMPLPSARFEAEQLFRQLLPDADEIEVRTMSQVTFIDCAENFCAIGCPSCGAEIPNGWWRQAMDHAYETRFTRLDVSSPCVAWQRR